MVKKASQYIIVHLNHSSCDEFQRRGSFWDGYKKKKNTNRSIYFAPKIVFYSIIIYIYTSTTLIRMGRIVKFTYTRFQKSGVRSATCSSAWKLELICLVYKLYIYAHMFICFKGSSYAQVLDNPVLNEKTRDYKWSFENVVITGHVRQKQ